MTKYFESWVRGRQHNWSLGLLHQRRHCTIESVVEVVKDKVDILKEDESLLLLTAPLLLHLPLLPPHLLALGGLVQPCQHCLPIPAAACIHLQHIEAKLGC